MRKAFGNPASPIALSPPVVSVESRIPERALPRGALGDISEIGFFDGWCSANLVIRESIGKTRKKFMWNGPQVEDEEEEEEEEEENELLRRSILAGKYPVCIPDTHCGVLTSISLPREVEVSLASLGVHVHNAYDKGEGAYNIDEYCMILDKMPEGYESPEAFILDYLRNPNEFAHDESFSFSNPCGIFYDFDTYNKFCLKKAGSKEDVSDTDYVPCVGDWYHIRIPGNNGDVVIVETNFGPKRCSATVATMTDRQWGPMQDHPVSGRRQFGIEQLQDGTYRVYTRGFDRQTTIFMDIQIGNMAQDKSWSSLMRALADEYDGRPERYDQGGWPVWGWVRQIPARVLLASIKEFP